MVVVRCVGHDKHRWVGRVPLYLLPGRAALGATTSIITPGKYKKTNIY